MSRKAKDVPKSLRAEPSRSVGVSVGILSRVPNRRGLSSNSNPLCDCPANKVSDIAKWLLNFLTSPEGPALKKETEPDES
jgi:hypothetical protein